MQQENEQAQHFTNLRVLHNQVEELFGYADASDFIAQQNHLARCFLEHELAQPENNPEYIKEVLFYSDQLKVFLVKLQELL